MKKERSFLIIIILSFTAFFYSCVQSDKNEEFWKWFAENENKFYNYDNSNKEIFNELHQKLIGIDSNLVYEFSPPKNDSPREFTISADGITESFPAVIKLVNKAPKFSKWKINAFRQRNTGDNLEIVYDDSIKVEYNDIYFAYANDSAKLGIELNVRNYRDSRDFDNAVYILLDGLIGEYDMGTKISWIEIKKLEESQKDSLYKIIELISIVDTVK